MALHGLGETELKALLAIDQRKSSSVDATTAKKLDAEGLITTNLGGGYNLTRKGREALAEGLARFSRMKL